MVLGQAVFLFAFAVAGTAAEALLERHRNIDREERPA